MLLAAVAIELMLLVEHVPAARGRPSRLARAVGGALGSSERLAGSPRAVYAILTALSIHAVSRGSRWARSASCAARW